MSNHTQTTGAHSPKNPLFTHSASIGTLDNASGMLAAAHAILGDQLGEVDPDVGLRLSAALHLIAHAGAAVNAAIAGGEVRHA